NFYTYDNPVVTCNVCSEKTKDFVTLMCGHRFDYGCLRQIRNNKCPLCRHEFEL
ncbi:RING-HC finger protein, partial [Streptococcus mitis]|uniref:RING-HC finger protein n=1 Tax=Streptococcus mitis TaxID=28037 RepID=UPI0037DA387A